MIKKRAQCCQETRTSMRAGTGSVTIVHYLKSDEITARCRLCAKLIIPPGSSIGAHEHTGEDEIFIVHAGTGTVTDNGVESTVEAGDAILTGNGATHAIKNTGTIDLVITAVIMQY